jgi:DNA-binding transcriptional ArsR family regulator
MARKRVVAPVAKPGASPAVVEKPDYYYLETVEQLQVLADPLRYRIVLLLGTPRTGAQLGRLLGLPRTQVHYHLKQLEAARLIRLHSTGVTAGMTEKYYVVVARILAFDRLISRPSALDGGSVSLATYKAVAEFLAAMLNVSRERILDAPTNLREEDGFWLDFTGIGTEAQVAGIRQKLMALRDEVLAMTRNRPPPDEMDGQVRFNLTAYLTPQNGAPARAIRPRRS